MNSLLLAIAIFLASANASFTAAVGAVVKAANSLASKVDDWTPKDGMRGAVGLQAKEFPAFAAALGILSSSVDSASLGDLEVGETKSFSSSIVELLEALSSKASDFGAHTDGIIKRDLKQIEGPSVDIVNNIAKLGLNDCSKFNSQYLALNAIKSAFDEVDSAFGLPTPAFHLSASCSMPAKSEHTQTPSLSKSPNKSKTTSAHGIARGQSSKSAEHKSATASGTMLPSSLSSDRTSSPSKYEKTLRKSSTEDPSSSSKTSSKTTLPSPKSSGDHSRQIASDTNIATQLNFPIHAAVFAGVAALFL